MTKSRDVLIFVLTFLLLVVGSPFAYKAYRNSWKTGGDYYLIDENGNRVSGKSFASGGLKYDQESGIIIVKTGNRWPQEDSRYKTAYALIDKNGKYVVRPYRGNGWPKLLDNGYYLIDGYGMQPYLVDSTGKTVTTFSEGTYKIGYFSHEGLAPFAALTDDGALWGYIDEAGNVVIEPQFSKAFEFGDNGLAAVEDPVTEKRGYINTKGEYVIEPKYRKAKEFSEGLAAVKSEDDTYDFINEKGEVVLDTDYTVVDPFKNGVTSVRNENEKYVLIDKAGNVITDKEYEFIYDFHNGYAQVQDENDKYGYIDLKGNLVIDCQYMAGGQFSGNGTAPVMVKEDLWGYISTDGSWFIEPQFKDASSFDSVAGVALVSK